MRIVVVGTQSYLGFHLTKALYEAGYEVIAADFFEEISPSLAHFKTFFGEKVTVLPLKSIHDLKKFHPEGVINLLPYKGGQKTEKNSGVEPVFLPEHQVFQELLSLVLNEKSRLFVNVELADVIYGRGTLVPFDERALTIYPNLWGASQIFTEHFLAAWVRKLKADKVLSTQAGSSNFFSFACLRMSEVFGPALNRGEALPGWLGEIGKAMLGGNLPQLGGGGNQSRDLLYIEDAVAALMACIKKLEDTSIDDIFNVGSGVELRDSELVQALLRDLHELGSDPDSDVAVQSTLKLNAPAQNATAGEEKQQRFCLECTKFRAFFGWRPRHDIFRSLKTSVEESFGA